MSLKVEAECTEQLLNWLRHLELVEKMNEKYCRSSWGHIRRQKLSYTAAPRPFTEKMLPQAMVCLWTCSWWYISCSLWGEWSALKERVWHVMNIQNVDAVICWALYCLERALSRVEPFIPTERDTWLLSRSLFNPLTRNLAILKLTLSSVRHVQIWRSTLEMSLRKQVCMPVSFIRTFY